MLRLKSDATFTMTMIRKYAHVMRPRLIRGEPSTPSSRYQSCHTLSNHLWAQRSSKSSTSRRHWSATILF